MLRFTKSVWQTLCLSVLCTANLFAAKLTKEQQTELRKNGTITVYDENGKKEGHFSVRFMPGSNNVRNDMKLHWSEVKEDLVEFLSASDFWTKKVKYGYLDALNIVTRTHKRHGLACVKADYTEMKNKNQRAKGQFGEKVQKVKNGLEFAGKLVGRSLMTVGGALVGSLYGAIVPTAIILSKPVKVALQAVIPGTVIPVARFAWNGAAWLAVKGNEEPKQEQTNFVVSYHPAIN